MRKDRIEARLQALRINQFEAAERAGKHSHFIYDFMIDRKRSFKGDGPIRLAQALQCSVEYLTGESDDVGLPPATGPIFTRSTTTTGLPVAGVVEAGVFRRPGAIKLPSGEIPVPPFPMYPPEDQAAFIVKGGGLDERGISPGMILVATKTDVPESELQNGSLVIVERSKSSGREVEVSAREVQHFPDRTELRARSRTENIPTISLENGKSIEAGYRVTIAATVLGAVLLL